MTQLDGQFGGRVGRLQRCATPSSVLLFDTFAQGEPRTPLMSTATDGPSRAGQFLRQ